jgi:hypothetical protein
MADTTKVMAEAPSQLEERLEDGLRCSFSAFQQLATLFFVAKNMAPEHSHLCKLLELGWHVAGDMENHVCGILDQFSSPGVPE